MKTITIRKKSTLESQCGEILEIPHIYIIKFALGQEKWERFNRRVTQRPQLLEVTSVMMVQSLPKNTIPSGSGGREGLQEKKGLIFLLFLCLICEYRILQVTVCPSTEKLGHREAFTCKDKGMHESCVHKEGCTAIIEGCQACKDSVLSTVVCQS